MIELNPEIFHLIEKKFTVQVFSHEYGSTLEVGFDTFEELEAATIGLSLEFKSLKINDQTYQILDLDDIKLKIG